MTRIVLWIATAVAVAILFAFYYPELLPVAGLEFVLAKVLRPVAPYFTPGFAFGYTGPA